jgi:hypothetical protein
MWCSNSKGKNEKIFAENEFDARVIYSLTKFDAGL